MLMCHTDTACVFVSVCERGGDGPGGGREGERVRGRERVL